MKPLHLTTSGLARALKVPARQVSDIANERRGLDAEMVLRLARYFGISPEFWMAMQTKYDLEVAEDAFAERIRREVKPAPHEPVTGELIPVKTATAGPSTRPRKNRAGSLRMTS